MSKKESLLNIFDGLEKVDDGVIAGQFVGRGVSTVVKRYAPKIEEKIDAEDLVNETTIRIGAGLLGFYAASQGVIARNPTMVHGGIAVAADMAEMVTNWALDSIDKDGAEARRAGITYRPRSRVPC